MFYTGLLFLKLFFMTQDIIGRDLLAWWKLLHLCIVYTTFKKKKNLTRYLLLSVFILISTCTHLHVTLRIDKDGAKERKRTLLIIKPSVHIHFVFWSNIVLQPSTGVSDEDFVSYVSKWHEVGASLIGGCCRTTPNTIRGISRVLHEESAGPASPP